MASMRRRRAAAAAAGCWDASSAISAAAVAAVAAADIVAFAAAVRVAAAAAAAALWNRCAAIGPTPGMGTPSCSQGAASPDEEAIDCNRSAAETLPEVELSDEVERLRRPGRHMAELIAARAESAMDQMMNEAKKQDNLWESQRRQSKVKPARI
jgi:hypothetical protein